MTCKFCGQPVENGANICPFCNKKLRKHKKIIPLIIIALSLFFASVFLVTAICISIALFTPSHDQPSMPPKITAGLFVIGDQKCIFYGNGKSIALGKYNYTDNYYDGYVTQNEKYAVYTKDSEKTSLFIFNTLLKTEKKIYSASNNISILCINNLGVFFSDEKNIYSYNFKKNSLIPICEFNSKDNYCISETQEEEMSIAFVQNSSIFTYEISSGAFTEMISSVNHDDSTIIFSVTADGKNVSFGNSDAIYYSNEKKLIELHSTAITEESLSASLASIIYPTKEKETFIVITSQDRLFVITSGIICTEIQVPFGEIYSSSGIPAKYDNDFDAFKPFFVCANASNTSSYSINKIYTNENLVLTICENATAFSFCGNSSLIYTINNLAYLYNEKETIELELNRVKTVLASPYGETIAYIVSESENGEMNLYSYSPSDGITNIATNIHEHLQISHCGKNIYYISKKPWSVCVFDGTKSSVILESFDGLYIGLSSFLEWPYIDPNHIWIMTTENPKFFNGKTTKDIKKSYHLNLFKLLN